MYLFLLIYSQSHPIKGQINPIDKHIKAINNNVFMLIKLVNE